MCQTNKKVTVRQAGYFISGGMNVLIQCHAEEPGVNTILTDSQCLQWKIVSVTHDKIVAEKAKAAGYDNVIVVQIEPIDHKKLPTNNSILDIS